MRLEIIIPDERPEAQILRSISDPNAFVLDLVRRSEQGAKLEVIPDYMAAVQQIRQSPSFKTKEEIDTYISDLRSEW